MTAVWFSLTGSGGRRVGAGGEGGGERGGSRAREKRERKEIKGICERESACSVFILYARAWGLVYV